ncbi:hypothetical protein Tco_1301528 [Tanacetum coccineum]
MLLAMKDEAGSNLNDEENDFMLDNSFGDETLEEQTVAVIMMARIQPVNDNGVQNPNYDANSVSALAKKAFKEREDRYLKDIIDLEEKLSSRDRIVYKIGQSIQTIHMLGKTLNQVYDPFLKAGLGYKNPERLKKAIAAQPKMYHGEKLYSTKLKIDSPDSEETLEDVKESQLKMRNKMVQLDYNKLNVLYETFIPQKESSVDQTYFLIPSTSNICSESNKVKTDSQIPKMPKESKLLKIFKKMALAINALRDRIDVTLLEDRKRRWMSDSQNSLREFYKTDVIPMSVSLSKTLKELMEEVQEMLNIFESMEQKVEEKSPKEYIFQTEIDRLLEVSITREIQDCVLISVAEQKNELLENEIVKILNDSKDIQANLLKQIKILKNDFKRSQAQSIDFELKLQHQKEKMACDVSWKSRLSKLNDENVLLKTQVDSVVQERENIKLEYRKLFNSIKATRAQHQQEVNELIESISQKMYAYGDVHSKNQDLLMAKKVSNLEDNIDRSKPVTSHSTPKNEQKQKKNSNVIARLRSSNSVRRPKSKDTKSKNRVLKNTNAKSSSAYVRNTPSSVRIDSNKRETKNSNEYVFMLSHEKCGARYDLSRDSMVKRALFTTPVAAQS